MNPLTLIYLTLRMYIENAGVKYFWHCKYRFICRVLFKKSQSKCRNSKRCEKI